MGSGDLSAALLTTASCLLGGLRSQRLSPSCALELLEGTADTGTTSDCFALSRPWTSDFPGIFKGPPGACCCAPSRAESLWCSQKARFSLLRGRVLVLGKAGSQACLTPVSPRGVSGGAQVKCRLWGRVDSSGPPDGDGTAAPGASATVLKPQSSENTLLLSQVWCQNLA